MNTSPTGSSRTPRGPSSGTLPESTVDLLKLWLPLSPVGTPAGLASALGVGRSVVANWFTRDSRLSWAQVAAIDGALFAGGAFEDVVRALTTPSALAPDTTWQFNPQGDPGPHWAWLRPADADGPPLTATIRIGPFVADYAVPDARIGGMVWAPAAPINPATEIVLSRKGWVDFGRGRPVSAFPVPVTEIVESTRLHDPMHDHAFGVGVGVIERAGRRRPRWLDEVADATGAPVELLREAVQYVKTAAGTPQQLPSVAEQPSDSQIAGGAYAVLREQRRYSQADVVAAIAEGSDPIRIAKSTLDRFESDADVRVPLLGARLDRLYGADGRTGCWRVATRTGSRGLEVEFPDWWIGPVWVRFMGSGVAPCALEWSPWRKPLEAFPGGVAETRRAAIGSDPLTVRVPPGWRALAGVGRYPGAQDANQRWLVMHEAVQQFLRYYFDVAVKAAGGSLTRTIRLLRSADGDPS